MSARPSILRRSGRDVVRAAVGTATDGAQLALGRSSSPATSSTVCVMGPRAPPQGAGASKRRPPLSPCSPHSVGRRLLRPRRCGWMAASSTPCSQTASCGVLHPAPGGERRVGVASTARTRRAPTEWPRERMCRRTRRPLGMSARPPTFGARRRNFPCDRCWSAPLPPLFLRRRHAGGCGACADPQRLWVAQSMQVCSLQVLAHGARTSRGSSTCPPKFALCRF
mmetsp:Transcript_32034/g.92315  ORF Transcript_32034/g.92315 Transcript_32034/m.92315 type:complete len:224 (+) Transcript_32034:1720-2391(+)